MKQEVRQEPEIVVGIHSALTLLERSPERVRRVLLAEKRHGKRLHVVRELAVQCSVSINTVPRATLDRMSKGSQHQGVILEIDEHATHTEVEFERAYSSWKHPLILAIDGVQDPRNLGACLRTADGAGVDAVLLNKNRCAPLTEVVHRTSTGALDALFVVQISNLARRLEWLKKQGAWITGTYDSASAPYTDIDYRGSIVLVIGGEERGLRKLTRDKCDHLVSIPMHGYSSSLNVSVASGIVLYEIRRQRET